MNTYQDAAKELDAELKRELDAVQEYLNAVLGEAEAKTRDGSFFSPHAPSLFDRIRRARIDACVHGVELLGRVLQRTPVESFQLLGEALSHPDYLRVLRYVAGQGPRFALAWLQGRDHALHAVCRVRRVVDDVLSRRSHHHHHHNHRRNNSGCN